MRETLRDGERDSVCVFVCQEVAQRCGSGGLTGREPSVGGRSRVSSNGHNNGNNSFLSALDNNYEQNRETIATPGMAISKD